MRAPVLSVSIAATAALLLAGCSDSPTSAAADGSASPTMATSASPTGSMSASPTDGADTDQPDQASADCPVGQWKMDNDDWASLVQSLIPAGSTVASVEGDVILTLAADGSYSTAYQDWTITMAVEGGTAVIHRDGTDSGTWEDTDGRAVLTDQNPNSVVDGYVETSEGRIDMPNTDSVRTSLGASFAYECQGTTMQATTDDGTFAFTRAS